MKALVFSDLDGTLLDARTYSYDAARPALGEIARRKIPLVLSSSKTRAEIELWRRRLGNLDPFISENGGGIFVPNGTCPRERIEAIPGAREEKHGFSVPLGADYAELREGLARLRAMGYAVRGFGDMSVDEIAALTGLPPPEAAMAKLREHDEPFLLEDSGDGARTLVESAARIGFRVTQGRFYHLLGESDKGRAVSLLIELYSAGGERHVTAALGDRPNDIPMLRCVDRPIVVQLPSGAWDPRIDVPGLIRASGVGPAGWNRAVMDFLADIAAGD